MRCAGGYRIACIESHLMVAELEGAKTHREGNEAAEPR
jgi:hypothetical protein